MRMVFLGSPPFAVPAFAALMAGPHAPVALVTAPPRGAGRGRREAPNALAEQAAAAGLPVLRPDDACDPGFLREFAALAPDLAVVIAYGQILSDEFLAIPRLGSINLHGSLLPRWRGASPVQAVILAGEPDTGVSVQHVVRKLDAGAVLASRSTPVGVRESAPELAQRLAAMGAELLVEFVAGLGAGPLPPGRPQVESEVSVCRRVRKEDACLDWNEPVDAVDRRVRAMAGWPVAETRLPDGSPLKVHAGEPEERPPAAAAAPGTILGMDSALVVACGAGAYRIKRVQRAGKQPLAAQAFLRGAGLAVGERLRAVEEVAGR
ncbi:MAG TPA: methionyl-tRNA formyltransferase [Planctomycetota bacterium]